ncbi:MAG: hypothetical protein K2Q18_13260 [Bdellovibrionales bacterium]|nr:hypothetical protein [Bdellovibrionales bacterium]
MKQLIFCLGILTFTLSASATELTMNSESTFDPGHTNRFTLMAGVNSSLTKAADLQDFALSYGRQLDSYWIDANVMMTSGLFREFGENHPPATGSVNSALEEQKNTLTSIGVGIGRETRYAQTLLPFNDIYELMAANLTYNMYKEDFTGQSFNGPGLLAKFAVYKRMNDYFSAGVHFNYNISVVKRSKNEDAVISESNSSRSLTLGFLTIGFNISLYL